MKKKLIVSLSLLILVVFNSRADEVVWMRSLEDAKVLSQAMNKPILLDFWAHWCGPCKKMDSKVWSTDEIKELMKNFIPVKIDIDIDQEISRRYSVKSIPTIIVTDSWGNQLYKETGYKDKKRISELLTNFSVNLAGINRVSLVLFKKQDHVGSNVRVAQKHQDYGFLLKKDAKVAFIRRSNYYLRKAKKYNKGSGNLVLDERIDLLKMLNKSYMGSPKSVLKKIDKSFKSVAVKNQGLFYFVKYYSAHASKNTALKNEMLAKLNSREMYKLYLKKTQKYGEL
ncbi:MAG: hypothetical protein COB98_02135 [Flavobacteriaceae bacterium]|nr:MAG: hypothetical protein COB98_02135 [Flavobacteriaceae bacterium]